MTRNLSLITAIALLTTTGLVSAAGDHQQKNEQLQEGRQLNESDLNLQRNGAAGDERVMQLTVAQLKGKTVMNRDGRELGQVEEVLRGKHDGALYAVVPVGGFLGIGDKRVAFPLEQLRLVGDRLLTASNRTEAEIASEANAFQQAKYEGVDQNMRLLAVKESQGAQVGPSFAELDTDGNGYLNRDEAILSPALQKHWGVADANSDGHLDRGEFSAFEQAERSASAPPQSAAPRQAAPAAGSR